MKPPKLYILLKISVLKVNGLAIFPFIFTKNGIRSSTLINHELIHHQQQLELFIIPFYFFYIVLYLIGLMKHKNSHEAYMSICFEKEAYANEKDTNYLKKRRLWAFLKYL